MINEEEIRHIYEGCYKIVEIMGSDKYTRDLSLILNRLLTNRIQGAWDDVKQKGRTPSKESLDIVNVIKKIDEEYYPKFTELSDKQEGATTQ